MNMNGIFQFDQRIKAIDKAKEIYQQIESYGNSDLILQTIIKLKLKENENFILDSGLAPVIYKGVYIDECYDSGRLGLLEDIDNSIVDRSYELLDLGDEVIDYADTNINHVEGE